MDEQVASHTREPVCFLKWNVCVEKDGFYHSPKNTFGVGKIAYEISLEQV